MLSPSEAPAGSGQGDRPAPATETVVGVYIDAGHDPGDIFKTLYHLAFFAGIPHQVVLLCDALPPAATRHLAPLSHLAAITDAGGRGRPFFFNALIRRPAERYFFVNAGVLVTEGCLAGLAEILAASPVNGLVGPTLNNCWHAQGQFDDPEPLAVDVAARAARLRQEFAGVAVDTAPLYGLGEALLAVSGAAVQAVGPADVRYGEGFCWEMDYAARAVWAGFRILWARGAYAHAVSGGGAEERQRTFASNKRRYQEKFCRRHLRGETTAYCDHCLGAGCADFAPSREVGGRPAVVADRGGPLISCVMPTRDRPEYVQQALRYFERQDYPHKEMIVLYEKAADLPAGLADSPAVRLVKSPRRATIGEKRNLGCTLARGEIIAQWDDDDWCAPERLSRQAAPLVAGQAEISGIANAGFYDVNHDRYWKCSPELFARMFVEGVLGGTLVFRKGIWGGAARYPHTSLREDADFLVLAQRQGARLVRVEGDGLYAYIRHGRNSWQCLPRPAHLGQDGEFYLARQARSGRGGPAVGRRPLVSCIMPTRDRPAFLQRALALYLDQEYPNRELIVVDDGAAKVGHLLTGHRIVYLPLSRPASIGAKRNIACEAARGEIIVHLDDDDWYAANWLAMQVEHLLAARAEVTGLDTLFFYDSGRGEAWRYRYPVSGCPPSWVHGATLCYRKECWRHLPFPDIDVGEDCAFLWRRRAAGIVPHGGIEGYIGHIHAGNASPKQTGDACWAKITDPARVQRFAEAMTLATATASSLALPPAPPATGRWRPSRHPLSLL